MAEEVSDELTSIPEDEFAVYGKVYAFPEHADALERAYAETTRLAASKLGNLYYCISRDGEDPTIFHFFERYAGRVAFEAHVNDARVQSLVKQEYMKAVEAKIVRPIFPAQEG